MLKQLKRCLGNLLRQAARKIIPIRFRLFHRLIPVSDYFGFDRGRPVDRYYVESFLEKHHRDIEGRVLEVQDANYTRQFGGDRVTHSDVLHVKEGNPEATIVGDLVTGNNIPVNAFDCMILTQVYPSIYDVRPAILHTYRALKPGGILLATLSGISQISRYDMERWGEYWRFTDASARRLFGEVFSPENVTVETWGNVLAACAFLLGLPSHELKSKQLDYHDPDYQVLITVRAVKP